MATVVWEILKKPNFLAHFLTFKKKKKIFFTKTCWLIEAHAKFSLHN